ncbi:hypothetical protein D3C83_81860 [compost metagenome]
MIKAETASCIFCDEAPGLAALSTVAGAKLVNLSFNSTIMRSANFLPTPGIDTKRTWSPFRNARASSSAGIPDKILSASLGPIPDTPIKSKNTCFSPRS